MGNKCSSRIVNRTINPPHTLAFTLTPDQFVKYEFAGINRIKEIDQYIMEFSSLLRNIQPEIDTANSLIKNGSLTQQHIDTMKSHQKCLQTMLSSLETSCHRYTEYTRWISKAREELRLTRSVSQCPDSKIDPKILPKFKQISKWNREQYISNQFRRLPDYTKAKALYNTLKTVCAKLETTIFQRIKLRDEFI